MCPNRPCCATQARRRLDVNCVTFCSRLSRFTLKYGDLLLGIEFAPGRHVSTDLGCHVLKLVAGATQRPSVMTETEEVLSCSTCDAPVASEQGIRRDKRAPAIYRCSPVASLCWRRLRTMSAKRGRPAVMESIRRVVSRESSEVQNSCFQPTKCARSVSLRVASELFELRCTLLVVLSRLGSGGYRGAQPIWDAFTDGTARNQYGRRETEERDSLFILTMKIPLTYIYHELRVPNEVQEVKLWPILNSLFPMRG